MKRVVIPGIVACCAMGSSVGEMANNTLTTKVVSHFVKTDAVFMFVLTKETLAKQQYRGTD